MTSVRSLLIRAAREFNAGRYFEAHEALEEGLDEVPDDLWHLITGLIQIAVGYHKVTQSLWSGAVKMLESGLEKTGPFAADAAGLNLAALRRRVRRDIAALRNGNRGAGTFTDPPPRLSFMPRN